MKRKVFFEEVIEKIAGIVVQSNIREATGDEIVEAELLHREGKCPHTIVYDESGWPYDFRMCHTCGLSLGTV
jgi:hypothetical protein